MFIDTSVFIAIIAKEPEKSEFIAKIAHARRRYTSPLVVLETVMRASSLLKIQVKEAGALMNELIAESQITVVGISGRMGQLAVDAFDRYGKGRGHPAQLNLAHCMGYACAKAYRAPILFKGRDFSHTDLKNALAEP